MIKKHPVIFIILCLVSLLLIYLVFNLALPTYKRDFKNDVYNIKDEEYERRLVWDWMIIEKDRLIGDVIRDDDTFRDRLNSLIFPNRIYSVKGDSNNVSYYIAPSMLSEFKVGTRLYRKDFEYPNIGNIKPYRIELGEYYSLDLKSETFYYTEDDELVNEILNIIHNYEAYSEFFEESVPKGLHELNEKSYGICFFTEDVPGSVYYLPVKVEGYKEYIDINPEDSEKEYIDISIAIEKLITEGIKVIQD